MPNTKNLFSQLKRQYPKQYAENQPVKRPAASQTEAKPSLKLKQTTLIFLKSPFPIWLLQIGATNHLTKALSKPSLNSERAKRITASVASFIAKDLHPQSDVNKGYDAGVRPEILTLKVKVFHIESHPETIRDQNHRHGITKDGVSQSCDLWWSVE